MWNILSPVFAESKEFFELLHCVKLIFNLLRLLTRSNPPEVFLGKEVLKTWSKSRGEHPCWSVISIKLLCITLWHGCSPITLLHIFRIPFPKKPLGGCFWSAHFWLITLFYVPWNKNKDGKYGKIGNGKWKWKKWKIWKL